MRNAVPHGEVPFGSAVHQAGDFPKSESIYHLLKLCALIRTNDEHHLVNFFALLEPFNRMRNHRLVSQPAQQLIKSHTPAAAGGYNNGGNHEGVVILTGPASSSSQRFLDGLAQLFAFDAPRGFFGSDFHDRPELGSRGRPGFADGVFHQIGNFILVERLWQVFG